MNDKINKENKQTRTKYSAYLEKAENDVYTFVMSEEKVDRDGELVVLDGLDINEFLKNPQLFYNHESRNYPIGLVKSIRREGNRLIGDIWLNQITGTLTFMIGVVACYFGALQQMPWLGMAVVLLIILIDLLQDKKRIRNKIKLVQTPQTFHSKIILPAFNIDYKDKFTDEATVVEAFGLKVHLIEGEENNFKISRPADLLLAESIIS